MDWRTSTLNSHYSTAQRLLNRNFASQSLTARPQRAGTQNADDGFQGGTSTTLSMTSLRAWRREPARNGETGAL